MPRYRYQCGRCDNIVMVFHSMNETYNRCIECDIDDSMKKILTTPLKHVTIEGESNNLKVGDITRDHIEANREILEEEKQKASVQFYEPS